MSVKYKAVSRVLYGTEDITKITTQRTVRQLTEILRGSVLFEPGTAPEFERLVDLLQAALAEAKSLDAQLPSQMMVVLRGSSHAE